MSSPVIAFQLVRVHSDGTLRPGLGPRWDAIYREGGQLTGSGAELVTNNEPGMTAVWRDLSDGCDGLIGAIKLDHPQQDGWGKWTGEREQLIALFSPPAASEAALSYQHFRARYDIPVFFDERKFMRFAAEHAPLVAPQRRFWPQGQSAYNFADHSSRPRELLRFAGAIAIVAAVMLVGGQLTVAGITAGVLVSAVLLLVTLLAVAGFSCYEFYERARATPEGERWWETGTISTGDPPMFPQALAGYRMWRLTDDGRLHPAASDGAWLPGRNVAACNRSAGRLHRAPGAACHCGFNAFNWPNQAWRSGYRRRNTILGAVTAGGEARVHAEGFRAELAAPIALVRPRPFSGLAAPARRAAERYGIPLLRSRRELVRYAGRSGASPVPRSATPPASPREMRTQAIWVGTPHSVFALLFASPFIALMSTLDGILTVGGRPWPELMALAASAVVISGVSALRLWRLVRLERVRRLSDSRDRRR